MKCLFVLEYLASLSAAMWQGGEAIGRRPWDFLENSDDHRLVRGTCPPLYLRTHQAIQPREAPDALGPLDATNNNV
jgi:hypothetical protein